MLLLTFCSVRGRLGPIAPGCNRRDAYTRAYAFTVPIAHRNSSCRQASVRLPRMHTSCTTAVDVCGTLLRWCMQFAEYGLCMCQAAVCTVAEHGAARLQVLFGPQVAAACSKHCLSAVAIAVSSALSVPGVTAFAPGRCWHPIHFLSCHANPTHA